MYTKIKTSLFLHTRLKGSKLLKIKYMRVKYVNSFMVKQSLKSSF